MFEGLIRIHEPTFLRAAKAEGGVEHYLTEGAVIIAFAMYLFRIEPRLKHVSVHPDGEHAKRFDFAAWLGTQGFEKESEMGSTTFAGLYRNADGRTILVNPKAGVGDVVADIDGWSFVAECKGGVINTKHPGQLSRLRKGLCEAVGLSLAVEPVEGRRQFAVVPRVEVTASLAQKMRKRALAAGIEIALVDGRGNVDLVTDRAENAKSSA